MPPPTGEEQEDWQERLRDFVENSERPQTPLTSQEIKHLRILLQSTERRVWLWKRVKVVLPWVISTLVSASAGAKFLLDWWPHGGGK